MHASGSTGGEGRLISTTRWTRTLAVVSIACVALMVAAPAFGVQSPGGVTIYDDLDCLAKANTAKVTVPFSIGVTGLDPFSTNTLVWVTDKDAKPEIVYGPATLMNVPESGDVCLNALAAPSGLWKIDVSEPNGFTDSKVFTIEDSAVTTTTVPTTTVPTTTIPTTTTTTGSPSTTTSTAPVPTTTTNPTGPPVEKPFRDLPWVFERPELIAAPTVATTTTGAVPLPITGATSSTVPVAALAVAMITAGAFALPVGRRRLQ